MATKTPPPGTAEWIAKMTFASIYPHYLDKVEKKGRTREELNEVIEWLTGYGEKDLESLIADETTLTPSSRSANSMRMRLSLPG